MERPDLRDGLRFHRIDWDARNAPIRLEDLDHLPEGLRADPSFEVYQFQIARGSGRVVGFFDQANVFNLLLLDPMHNLQPSRDVNYNVRPTECSRTPYQAMKGLVLSAIEKIESGGTPEEVSRLLRDGAKVDAPYAQFIVVEQAVAEALEIAVQYRGGMSPEDVLLEALLSFADRSPHRG